MARPAVETRITGRRPGWSDSEPITGEARNCISAHSATHTPLIMPARALEPVNCSISVGRTGMTMPIDRTSSIAVTRMNAIAALLARKAAGDMAWFPGVRAGWPVLGADARRIPGGGRDGRKKEQALPHGQGKRE